MTPCYSRCPYLYRAAKHIYLCDCIKRVTASVPVILLCHQGYPSPLAGISVLRSSAHNTAYVCTGYGYSVHTSASFSLTSAGRPLRSECLSPTSADFDSTWVK